MLKLDDFKPVRLEDRELFAAHYAKYPQVHSDNTFTNMICWNHYAHYRYTYVRGSLVISSTIDGVPRFRPPDRPEGSGTDGRPDPPRERGERLHAHGADRPVHRRMDDVSLRAAWTSSRTGTISSTSTARRTSRNCPTGRTTRPDASSTGSGRIMPTPWSR